jgi:hypothetical protein
MTRSDLSVTVMAPVLRVCRYLGDITNIARGLPGVSSVQAGPAQMITIGYRAAAGTPARLAPCRFRIDRQRQRIEWEIRGPLRYSGTLSVFGDCHVSRVQSELRSDQPILDDAARDLHTQMLHLIAEAVQADDQMPSTPLPAGNVVEPTSPEQVGTLGNQGTARES